MSCILNGAYGSVYDVHTYFVNAAYGLFLKPFYTMFPQMGWYFIFELLGTFAAFTAISYALIYELGRKLGSLFSLLLLGALSPIFYFQLSFTQCATIYTAAGIILFSLGDTHKIKRFLIIGACFLTAGSIMRWEGFLLGMPLFCVLLVMNLHTRKKIYYNSVLALCILFTVIFGLKDFNNKLFSQGEYKHYAEYQPVRSFLGDGGFYDKESTFDELEERGRHGLDFHFTREWIFYDTQVFKIDSLQSLIDVANRNLYQPNWLRIPTAVLMTISRALMRADCWCWVIFCIVLISIPSKKSNLYPWISLGYIAFFLGYLLLLNRLVFRVESGIWLYAIACSIPFFSNKENVNRSIVKVHIREVSPILLFFSVAFTFFSISSQPLKEKWNLLEIPEPSHDWARFMRYTETHPNDAFILTFERYKELGKVKDNPFLSPRPGSWNNIFPFGYWNIYLPAMKKELEKRGVINPVKDIINSNVYVIETNPQPTFPLFYRNHYHKNIAADTVVKFGKINLLKYSLSTEGEHEETTNN